MQAFLKADLQRNLQKCVLFWVIFGEKKTKVAKMSLQKNMKSANKCSILIKVQKKIPTLQMYSAHGLSSDCLLSTWEL